MVFFVLEYPVFATADRADSRFQAAKYGFLYISDESSLQDRYRE